MRLYCFLFLLLCSRAVNGQSLAELERQLDSLLQKQEKSELLVGISYGNNPAYANKTAAYDSALVLKTFLSPSVTYYHKSGFYGSVSAYWLLKASKQSLYEWDLTAGYDYTKNKQFITGISYTRYLFADSADVPATPIKNELYAYFYFRKWWLQPGIILDYGWGKMESKDDRKGIVYEDVKSGGYRKTLYGSDFNVIAAVRHPFIFSSLLQEEDALVFIPSLALTMGTDNYYSSLKAMQYLTRSPLYNNKTVVSLQQEKDVADHRKFEPRAIDLTLNLSYVIGKVNVAPSFTVFKLLSGTDKRLQQYFTARITYGF
ncbi:hypothetical protein [Chitinophaga nivalis]|uniref:DUF3078 domain-containing protein n=1 Tax=Chitinophaga nivalis TaxID=2991709 RepID=A0ABT3IRH7_9BACT|nr:hypothetical protein [Chitinophaga nivalis]MCW3463754.1 hypothetical protein [Chitinophaga nivalis]MCW3486556.1 hypothetical protein [Chitinophaga nivalis]